MVTGQQHRAQTQFLELRNRLGGLFLNGVLQVDQAGQVAVHGHEDGGETVRASVLEGLAIGIRQADTVRGKPLLTTHHHGAGLHAVRDI